MKSQNTVLNPIRSLAKELLHFVFPSFCLHCKSERVDSSKLFCVLCEEWIYRFPLDECLVNKAVSLEREGIALSLLREKKGACESQVLSTMAAFMALQVLELNWPSFDFLIPSPNNSINYKLAKEVASYFNIPVKNCLKSSTEWRRHQNCSDRSLLVVDIELVFSTSLDILEEASPSRVYYIGLCRSGSFL